MTEGEYRGMCEEDLWAALREVPDPELPHVSLVDLGVILRIEHDDAARRTCVLLMPTFLGCPALEIMSSMIHDRLQQLGVEVEVKITREQLWSSDRISPEGRHKLAEAGIAPPAAASGDSMIPLLEPVRCPHCGSRRAYLATPFGPTPCRAIAHCPDCKQPFEQFKPL